MIRPIHLVLLIGITVLFSGWQQTQRPPNVVLIYADDLGYGELGCYGQQKIRTPHLDQLAKEGMRFEQFYAGAPVCAPSRCMLMTGVHSGHSYIRGNYELGQYTDDSEGGQMPLPPNTYTIGHLMQSKNYQTAIIGKWGLGMPTNTGNPNKQGFDYFYGYACQKQAHSHYPTHLWENDHWDTLRNKFVLVHSPLSPSETNPEAFEKFTGKDYAVDKQTEKALKFIELNHKKSFFLYLPFTLPHLSLQVPELSLNEYKGKFEEQIYRGEKSYASTLYPRATYAAMITHLDKQVGLVRTHLKKLGLDDNTLILFTSDNGGTFDVGGAPTRFFESNGKLRGTKGEVFEGGIRVPMIAYWKGHIKAGSTTNTIATQYDIMATLSELTNTKVPKYTDGISFLPTLLGKPQKQHEFLYFEFPESGAKIAVRIGDWKGVKTNLKANPTAKWQLYNLAQDLSETTDLANLHPELLEKMDAIVKENHVSSHIQEWEFINPKWKK